MLVPTHTNLYFWVNIVAQNAKFYTSFSREHIPPGQVNLNMSCYSSESLYKCIMVPLSPAFIMHMFIDY